MPGQAIGRSLGFGYPGTIARNGNEIIKTRPVEATSDPIYFGRPVVVNNDGTASLVNSTTTADTFAGIATRRIQSAVSYPNQNLGVYNPYDAVDILLRGNISVECLDGSPKVGEFVHVRIQNGDIGFVATASTDTITLTNCKWTTEMDANKVAEVSIITQQGI